MTPAELKELEQRLLAADAVFVSSRVYDLESNEIARILNELLVRVETLRIRKETTQAGERPS